MGRAVPLLLLVGVTAVWGYTFVPVQDAVETFPVFGFLAIRFLISAAVLAPVAARPLRRMPRRGIVAGIVAGVLLGLAYGLQTTGLERTTVSSTGFITGLYVVLTPIIALALFRTRVPAAGWAAIALSVAGLALLNGTPGGSLLGNTLVLGNAVAQSFEIALMERFAAAYDARGLTFLQMAAAAVGFVVVAVVLGDLRLPHGGSLWFAIVFTAIFAGALGYLVATWVQARTTASRAALVFTLEAPFAALFGWALRHERLGLAGWLGCVVMLSGILLAEPGAASTLRRLVPERVTR
jgi:drug/metabolite transporter (DMT)-like permease